MPCVCREMQSKTKISPTTQPLERPKGRVLRAQNACNTQCAEEELSFIVSENMNCCSHYGRHFEASYKLNANSMAE